MTTRTAQYEPLPRTGQAPGPVAGRFKWYPYEHLVLAAYIFGSLFFLFIDFGALMRKVVNGDLDKNLKVKGLSPGYFGIPRDMHDNQWRTWRENLDLLIIVAFLHLMLGYFIKKNLDNSPEKKGYLICQFLIGLAFVGYLEKAGILYLLLFTYATFVLIMLTHRWRIFPALLWGFCFGTLILNKVFDGYGFLMFSKSLGYLDESLHQAPVRWHIIYNMSVLKMISFGMDLYWAFRQAPVRLSGVEPLSYRHRQDTHQPLKNFNLLTYYSYLFYIPLFITGPTMSFNAWISQVHIPQTAYTNKGVMKYALRFIFIFVLFEVFLHTIYVNAIATEGENAHIWEKYFETHQLLFMGLCELFFLWFKFLIIWRFARLWALIDGIEAPENMNRCVANNYSFESFWRSWHRSFNQWLIRYLFVPLGGSKNKLWNVWIVFGFVALWHDIDLNLLLWSWIICLTLMPEMLVKWYFYQEKRRHLWGQFWFKYASACVGAVIILSMVISNLIGYGTGYRLLLLVLEKIKESQSWSAIIITYSLCTATVAFMFKLREREEDMGHMRGM